MSQIPGAAAPRPGAAPVLTRGLALLVASYTLLGAAAFAYFFAVSRRPLTLPNVPGAGLALFAAGVAGLVLAIPWAALPIPLLLVGLFRMRKAAPGSWRWPAAWAAAVAGGAGLEAVAVSYSSEPWTNATYVGPVTVSWASLAAAGGFVAVGAAMTAVLAGVQRAGRARMAAVARLPQAGDTEIAPAQPPGRQTVSKLAFAAFACGVSPFGAWVVNAPAWPAAAAAVVLGLIARRQIHARGQIGGTIALAGLIIGYIVAVDSFALPLLIPM